MIGYGPKRSSRKLDGLPFALDQAGACIEETGCGLSGYLNLYRSHGLELLRSRGALTSDHPDPVATTWALSFENIEKASPAAAELLRFCAFLHPDGIPEEVFSKGAPEREPALGVVASDTLAWNNALAEILKYSLFRRDPNAETHVVSVRGADWHDVFDHQLRREPVRETIERHLIRRCGIDRGELPMCLLRQHPQSL